jgi:predicted TIM-barrel fold metal-dependent hydrolase
VPHAGAALPIIADRVELLLPILGSAGGNHSLDVAGQLRKFYSDLAGAPVPKLLTALLQIAAKDRIFYGSDWPFTPVKAVELLLEKLEATPLFDEVLTPAGLKGADG